MRQSRVLPLLFCLGILAGFGLAVGAVAWLLAGASGIMAAVLLGWKEQSR